MDYLKDASFLKELDKQKLKTFYTKIIVLDFEENEIQEIQGRVTGGSINIQSTSAVRRTGTITFVTEDDDYQLTNVDNLLSINKKIKILTGFENHIDSKYDDIIWFPLGVFVITNPSINHSNSGLNITLQFKDKMCLLNGECGGNLPASVTFDSYDQIIGFSSVTTLPEEPNTYTVYGINGGYYIYENGWKSVSNPNTLIGSIKTIKQRLFDIIQTLVCNFGGEPIDNIIINDVPLEIKQSVRFIGTGTLYYNTRTSIYTLDSKDIDTSGDWKTFSYNEDCGYVYTDFVYPGDLVSNIGDNVCSVLDTICKATGNYEYFYDVNGRFVFQEIKNYLNTQYDPIQKFDDQGFILNNDNFYVDFANTSKSVYTFDEDTDLIVSYANAPVYSNIKNDYHIWGENDDGISIHYHLVVKEKPKVFNTYYVLYDVDDYGEYTGKVQLVAGSAAAADITLEDGVLTIRNAPDHVSIDLINQVLAGDSQVFSLEGNTLIVKSPDATAYVPEDWRAELYLRGLSKKMGLFENQIRPDIYEQELLDWFDIIYNMKDKCYKTDIVNTPNNLNYFIDYLDPIGKLADCSVDSLGMPKIYTYQQDGINRLYNSDIPNVIMINLEDDILVRSEIIEKCENSGQPYSNVNPSVFALVSEGTVGYTAEECARELLYQYTDYASSITLSTLPIYYLDANTRITVKDNKSDINGDYIIKSISIPLDARNVMNITATKALDRI